MKTILYFGPAGLNGGGAIMASEALLRELKDRNEFNIIDFNTSNSDNLVTRSNFLAFLDIIYMGEYLLKYIWKSDIVMFSGSLGGLTYVSPVLRLLTWTLRKPLIIRAFGGSLHKRYKESRLKRLLIRLTFKADAVLLETNELCGYFRKELPKAKIHQFLNGRKFKQYERVHSQRGFEAIFLGIIKESKGAFIIKEAGEYLKDYPIYITVCGRYEPDPIQYELKKNAPPNVKFNGQVPPFGVIEELHRNDVLILPSFYPGEGHAGVIIEAYIAGIPVIATRWNALPEIIEDGKTGILIEPKNAKELADALIKLYEDQELRCSMIKNIAAYRERFRIETTTEQLIQIIHKLEK
jgi:glycosyltransferase involved in cell wall biosynthesis